MPPNKESEKNRISDTPEITIMPTMIDDSEDKLEKKRDLSAIIPKSSQPVTEDDALQIFSRDNDFKTDGAISLATINVDGEITMSPNAKLPDPIDIEERKKIAQKNKGIFTKEKKKKKSNKAAQKFQNRMALTSLLVIIGLIGFYYWYKAHPTAKDFKPLPVEVELGEKLPIRTAEYVKPGVGKVDELLYVLDTSKVIVDVVGEYPFTVTYHGITKEGIITIQDTTPPDLITREVRIKEGESFEASQFVADCFDLSGCNYSFQEVDTETKYSSAGSHVVYIVATDAYNNTTTKKASLVIDSQGTTYRYVKYTDYDFKRGYEMEEYYELTFVDNDTFSAILRGTYRIVYKYQDPEKYKEAVKTYSGESGYTIDDAKTSIEYIKSVSSVGSNYTHLEDVEEYLRKEQFTKRN